MQKVISFTILLAVVLVSCGEQQIGDDLQSVKAALSSKKAAARALQEDIEKLEDKLSELDTTVREKRKFLVTTQPVVQKDFERYVSIDGSVQASKEPAFASSETGGRLVRMRWKEGDLIKKGQLVAKVDLQSLNKNMAELDKRLELAKDVYTRQKNLWDQNIGSEIQFLTAKNNVEALEKSKETLAFQLSKANVYAPMSGSVEQVMVKEGEMSGPGSPILAILNTSSLHVEVDVPEKYLGKVKRGAKVKIKFPAVGEEQMGKVSRLSTMINPANRTFRVETAIRANSLLKPNLLATMELQDFAQKDAVVLPSDLIQQSVGGQFFIFVKNGGTAKRVPIELGENYNGETVITSGLKGDEMILVKGSRTVADGDLIEVKGENSVSASGKTDEN